MNERKILGLLSIHRVLLLLKLYSCICLILAAPLTPSPPHPKKVFSFCNIWLIHSLQLFKEFYLNYFSSQKNFFSFQKLMVVFGEGKFSSWNGRTILSHATKLMNPYIAPLPPPPCGGYQNTPTPHTNRKLKDQLKRLMALPLLFLLWPGEPTVEAFLN